MLKTFCALGLKVFLSIILSAVVDFLKNLLLRRVTCDRKEREKPEHHFSAGSAGDQTEPTS